MNRLIVNAFVISTLLYIYCSSAFADNIRLSGVHYFPKACEISLGDRVRAHLSYKLAKLSSFDPGELTGKLVRVHSVGYMPGVNGAHVVHQKNLKHYMFTGRVGTAGTVISHTKDGLSIVPVDEPAESLEFSLDNWDVLEIYVLIQNKG